jgi:S-layer protein (TIGR01567 family)
MQKDGGKNMIQRIMKMMIAGLVVLGLFLAAVPAQAAIQEGRGQTANETDGAQDYLVLSSGTVSWNRSNFDGFFYDINNELGSERLTILDSASLIENRTIAVDKLVYSTSGDNKMLNVVKYGFNGNYNAAQLAGLAGFQAGNMSSEYGKYKIVGWQMMRYVAVNNKTNKLSNLVFEQGRNDSKTLTTGETWTLGQGWELIVDAIDARSTPRQVWFTLRKDGIVIDEQLRNDGMIYTGVRSNLAGESNVPLFVTYVDAIYSGPTSDMVRLKYTWLIDTNVIEVKKGDEYAIFNTTKADESIIEMRNSRFPVTLTRNGTIDLISNLNFKVADTEPLRFYPAGGTSGRIANETTGQKGNLNLSSGIVSWQPQNFGGLFYDLNDEFGNEKLTIIDSASLIGTRTILQDKLKYSTRSDNKMMNIVRYPFNGNYSAAEQAGLGEFQAGSMSSENGKYRIIGWQGERYVVVKNKTGKLSRLVIEQGSNVYDNKTLTTGETWDIGQGWELTVNAIDARYTPRQVWFTMKKDGVVIDEKIMNDGKIYTEVKSNLAGESNVPLFVTYVDTIYSGPTSDMVRFRYTWAIDTNVTEIRVGDWFGVFNVTGINSSTIELRNTDYYPISLNKDSTVYLMGGMGLKVADSDTLRFFPYMSVPLCHYSMISGHMFEDNNVNGLQEAGEPGMFNRTVWLKGRDICSNVNINTKIRTDAAGYYEFSNLRAGRYFLSEEIPAEWIPTTPGIYRVILTHSLINLTKDFGNAQKPAAIDTVMERLK